MIEIILGSFNQLFTAIDIFLKTKDLTLGAILAGLAPFIVLWTKVSKEKEKRTQRKLVERRQMQIAFNINEVMEHLGVKSKWTIQEIGSIQGDRSKLKKHYLLLQAVIMLRRKVFMEKLKSRKFWLTILAALIPVLNKEFGIHLDISTMGLMMTAIMTGVGFLAHVDAKKILAGIVHFKVTPQNTELAYTTFKEAIPYLKEIHDGINQLLIDVKQDNTTEAFKDAMRAYAQIKHILEANKHPEPVVTIVEEQGAA